MHQTRKQPKQNMTKKIIDHIPILVALIIIIGIVKLTLFYRNFSIPIKYFLGFSEITTAIADDLLYVLLAYCITICGKLAVEDLIKTRSIDLKDNKDSLFSLLIIIITIGLIIWRFFFENEYYNKIVIDAVSYFCLFSVIMQIKFIKDFSTHNKEFIFFLYFFFTTLLGIVSITSFEIKSVINGKYKGTKIVTNDMTYVSSDTTYYIGQTEKYVFIYNTSKHCLVLPISNVKQFDIYINEK